MVLCQFFYAYRSGTVVLLTLAIDRRLQHECVELEVWSGMHGCLPSEHDSWTTAMIDDGQPSRVNSPKTLGSSFGPSFQIPMVLSAGVSHSAAQTTVYEDVRDVRQCPYTVSNDALPRTSFTMLDCLHYPSWRTAIHGIKDILDLRLWKAPRQS